jgi:hypothetical protein
MQEHVDDAGVMGEIAAARRQHGADEMILRQLGDRLADERDPLGVLLDAQTTEGILQQVDPEPFRPGIHHQAQRAMRPQHCRERAQRGVGIRHMMQDAGAEDEIEAPAEICNLQEVELVKLEIGQAVPRLQEALVLEAGGRKIDPGDAAFRVGVGEIRRLMGAASRRQDVKVAARPAFGPDEGRVAGGVAEDADVLRQLLVQVLVRQRIRIVVVLARDGVHARRMASGPMVCKNEADDDV